MIRESRANPRGKIRRHFSLNAVSTRSIHVFIKHSNNTLFLKKLVWVQFKGSKVWDAIPMSQLDENTQEEIKGFVNSCNIIEFPTHLLTQCRACEQFLKENFRTVSNIRKYDLDQPKNMRYRSWDLIKRLTDETSTTDVSASDYSA